MPQKKAEKEELLSEGQKWQEVVSHARGDKYTQREEKNVSLRKMCVGKKEKRNKETVRAKKEGLREDDPSKVEELGHEAAEERKDKKRYRNEREKRSGGKQYRGSQTYQVTQEDV